MNVNHENPIDERGLQERIGLEEQKLAGLQAALGGVDGELKALAGERERYELVETICGSLDRLEELDAATLFWGEGVDPAERAGRIARVREGAAAFRERLDEVEARRAGLVADIEQQGGVLDWLDDELWELKEEEERRLAEWVVEREPDELPFRRLVMPWARGGEEDLRYRKSLLGTVAASILVAVLLGLIDLPIPERDELTELPERIAKIIEKQAPLPPPKAVIEEPEPEVPPEPEEPLVAEEQPPEELPEVVQPPAQVAETPAAPKEAARSKGILAFRDSFAKRAQAGPSARLGAQARIGNAGDAAVGRPQRAMVTTQAPGSSGGINLADISRDVGGGAGGQGIEGVAVTQVASSIGGDGSADRPLAGGPSAGRTDEEIQIVFDRYKAALYRLYNRALRRDPTLRGQLVLRLTIEPDGSVSMCQLQSTDMRAPDLADQVVARVQGFDFGAKEDIVAMTIVYPIDFLPAT